MEAGTGLKARVGLVAVPLLAILLLVGMDLEPGRAQVTRMAAVEERTWAPPGTIPAQPPKPSDRDAYSERLGWKLPYSEFISSGAWEVDDVLRPIYEEAGKALGREFPYPGD